MANEENLKKGAEFRFKAGEEQAKIARKGAMASAAVRRKKNASRKLLKEILTWKPEMTAQLARSLKGMGGDPDAEVTVEQLIMVALMQKSMKGDVRAIELYHEMLGEDAKTIIEEKRLKVQQAAVEAIRNSDGFMDAMAGVAEEVFTDGGDTPDTIEDSD